jgi:hypothetical protein
MEVSEYATPNAPNPMLVTLAGMVIDVSALAPNAYSPMLTTPDGMVIDVSALVPLNA